jgi:hypothetical protein
MRDAELSELWQQTYEAMDVNGALMRAVLPAALILRKDFLVVVGSTAGVGGPFGEGDGNGKMDGFISKFSWETGDIYVDPNADNESSKRFGSAADDWIIGACGHKSGIYELDSDAIYIVGASEENTGNNPNNVPRGFVSKVDSLSLETLWTTQFVPNMSDNDDRSKTWATKCVVDESINQIFIGGMVEDGTLGYAQTAFGKVDVFVAKLTSNDGTMEWLRQMGSDEDDRLADMLLMNDNKSLLIYGDTKGTFIRAPQAQRELILWTIEAENGAIGYADDPLTDPLLTNVPTMAALITEAPVAAPVVVVPETTPAPVMEAAQTHPPYHLATPPPYDKPTTPVLQDVLVPATTPSTTTTTSQQETTNNHLGRNIGIVAAVLIVLALAMYWYCRRRRIAHKKMMSAMFSEEAGGLTVSNKNGRLRQKRKYKDGQKRKYKDKDRSIRPGRHII